MKYKPRTKPFSHQARATLRAVRARNHAVFFEPRLGKSKTALDYVGILHLKGEVDRVLILAPRVAIDVWEQQIEQHFPYTAVVETFDEEWTNPSKTHRVTPVRFFLGGREETMRATRVKTRRGSKLVRPKQEILENWRPDVIIIDESHEYKRPGGRGAQDCWRMVTRLRRGGSKPYVLLLSGTPSPKGWRDLFAQFRIMDQSLLGTNASDFDEEYVTYGKGSRRFTIISFKNLTELKTIIRANSTVCTAEKAGLEGQIFFQSLRCSLPQRVRQKYVEMVDEFAVEIGGQLVTAKNQGVKRLRLAQITGGFLTDGTKIHGEKLAVAKDWLQSLFEQGEWAVVYAVFTPEVEALGRLGRSVGFDTTVIDGNTRRQDRTEAIRKFQAGAGRPHLLVFQHQAGSRAIELTRAAEVIFYSLPDGWVDFWQCLNRVRGPNQHRPVRITAILCRGTVDVAKLDSLRRKEDWHGEMMKSPRRYLLGLTTVNDV